MRAIFWASVFTCSVMRERRTENWRQRRVTKQKAMKNTAATVFRVPSHSATQKPILWQK